MNAAFVTDKHRISYMISNIILIYIYNMYKINMDIKKRAINNRWCHPASNNRRFSEARRSNSWKGFSNHDWLVVEPPI